MKITVDVLKNAAKELNEVVDPEPPIKINTKSTIDSLSEEIKAAGELLEKGDTILQSTMNVLLELEVDVDAAVKVKKDQVEKKETPKVEKKKEPKPKKEAEKTPVKKTGEKKQSKKQTESIFVSGLIEQKKYTRQDIIKLYLKKFPESTKNTINSLLSHGKNPKYQVFPKLIKQNKEGILHF